MDNKKKKKKRTVGAQAVELLNKIPDSTDPIEIGREMQKEYIDNLMQCVLDNRKVFSGNFYVIVLTKKERLLENVYRNYFFARISAPTPDYDQAVYKYDASTEEIIFLWCLPAKDICMMLQENAAFVHCDERDLLNFVMSFADGSLYEYAKKLNNESVDSNILQS